MEQKATLLLHFEFRFLIHPSESILSLSSFLQGSSTSSWSIYIAILENQFVCEITASLDRSGIYIRPTAVIMSGRVEAVDLFRGLTILFAVLVDSRGQAYDAERPWWMPNLDHAPWNGLYASDLIIPFFNFTMGVGMAIASASGAVKAFTSTATDQATNIRSNQSNRFQQLRDCFFRAFRIAGLGLILQGRVYDLDLAKVHIPGILQRQAACYLVIGTLLILKPVDVAKLKQGANLGDQITDRSTSFSRIMRSAILIIQSISLHWVVCGLITVFFLYLEHFFAVPGVDKFGHPCRPAEWKGFINSKATKAEDLLCNVSSYVDSRIFGCGHLGGLDLGDTAGLPQQGLCFDPEGAFTTLAVLLLVLLGVHTGLVIVAFQKFGEKSHLHGHLVGHLFLYGVICFALGNFFLYVLDVPSNKQMWSLSFNLISLGWTFIALCGVYVFHEVFLKEMMLQKWDGLNAYYDDLKKPLCEGHHRSGELQDGGGSMRDDIGTTASSMGAQVRRGGLYYYFHCVCVYRVGSPLWENHGSHSTGATIIRVFYE